MKTRAPSTAAIRLMMRELGAELTQLNHRVGAKAALKNSDMSVLDILARQGPLSPSALARAVQLHPATMTGVLDRLEADGWLVRERDPADRRAVLLRATPARVREMLGHFAGMNGAIDKIVGSYGPEELATIVDFLGRLIEAGRAANEQLAGD